MRRFHIIGNWKMHGSRSSLLALTQSLLGGMLNLPSLEVGVCPPFVYLDAIHGVLSSNNGQIKLGAQDVCDKEEGAYTGQVSASMLKEMGCSMVIVGHSERRHGCFESPDWVAQKAKAALEKGLQPIVCIGETLEERDAFKTKLVLKAQLAPIISLGEKALSQMVLAYEPVWAIGTGKTATPEQAQEIHAWIREEVAKEAKLVAQSLPILYGGSVKPNNAFELFKCPDIDGGLIGGASLNAGDFIEICQCAIKVLESMAAEG